LAVALQRIAARDTILGFHTRAVWGAPQISDAAADNTPSIMRTILHVPQAEAVTSGARRGHPIPAGGGGGRQCDDHRLLQSAIALLPPAAQVVARPGTKFQGAAIKHKSPWFWGMIEREAVRRAWARVAICW